MKPGGGFASCFHLLIVPTLTFNLKGLLKHTQHVRHDITEGLLVMYLI